MNIKKKIYIINKIDGIPISSSCHMTELMPYIENISNMEVHYYNLEINNLLKAINDINEEADIVFILHDFSLWNKGQFSYDHGYFKQFIQSIWNNKNIFVFPTQMASSGLLKSQFKENMPLMTKVIVGSEIFRKMLIKVDQGMSVPVNKIKVMNMPSFEYNEIYDNAQRKLHMNIKNNVIFTPGLLHPKKNYVELLENFKLVLQKHKNILYVLSFKSHPSISVETTWEKFNEIQDFIEQNNLEKNVRVSLDDSSEKKYIYMLELADLIVFPHDDSVGMYNGCMLDSLAMGKAIVSAESSFAEDLTRKSSVLLFRHNEPISFFDACTIVLENPEFATLIKEHNFEYGKNLAYSKVAQQYINQIKRFKSN